MKLKTHSGTKKRVRISGSGKIILNKSSKRHLLINKSKKAKGRNAYGQVVDKANKEALRKAIPGIAVF